mmetsp:Transcript_67068/g.160012  ORF Transcript_67068/g.160012 Transcript_67068/m.160012 type:complete len:407 (-) Transcript_67068:1128-2348(-)
MWCALQCPTGARLGACSAWCRSPPRPCIAWTCIITHCCGAPTSPTATLATRTATGAGLRRRTAAPSATSTSVPSAPSCTGRIPCCGPGSTWRLWGWPSCLGASAPAAGPARGTCCQAAAATRGRPLPLARAVRWGSSSSATPAACARSWVRSRRPRGERTCRTSGRSAWPPACGTPARSSRWRSWGSSPASPRARRKRGTWFWTWGSGWPPSPRRCPRAWCWWSWTAPGARRRSWARPRTMSRASAGCQRQRSRACSRRRWRGCGRPSVRSRHSLRVGRFGSNWTRSSARAVLPRSPRCEGFWKEQTCSMLKVKRRGACCCRRCATTAALPCSRRCCSLAAPYLWTSSRLPGSAAKGKRPCAANPVWRCCWRSAVGAGPSCAPKLAARWLKWLSSSWARPRRSCPT